MCKIVHLLLISLFLQSCSSDNDRASLLPDSSGNISEIVIVTDATNRAYYKNSLDAIFQKPILGLPSPSEPTFKILYTDQHFFKGYFKNHHHIIVIFSQDHLDDLATIFDQSLLAKLSEMFNKNPKLLGIKQVDLYAKNQNIFFVLAENRERMLTKIKEMDNQFFETALNHQQMSGYTKLLGTRDYAKDPNFARILKNNNYALKIPKTYRIAIENDEFIWLRKVSSTREQQFGILLFESPFTDTSDLNLSHLLSVRNRFTKTYIPGEIEGSYMKYSDVIVPTVKKSQYANRPAIDIYGWWNVSGDYMGGPSHIKVIVDKSRSRLIFAEGFLFYPNENKGESMQELNIILNTLKIK